MSIAADVQKRISMPRSFEPHPLVDQAAWVRQLSEPNQLVKLRISTLGACAKQTAYNIRGVVPSRPTSYHSRCGWASGDWWESWLLLAFTNASECEWHLTDTQTPVILRSEARGVPLCIPGSVDALIHNYTDYAVLECKSLSLYAYKEYKKREAAGKPVWDKSDSYWWQAQGYLHGLGEYYTRTYVLYGCKESGHIGGFWLDKDPAFPRMLQTHLDRVHSLVPPNTLPCGKTLVPSRLKRSEGRYPWQCSWCDHHPVCLPNTQSVEELDYRGLPTTRLYLRNDAGF